MTDGLLPPLSPGDVYLYAHGNGAIFVMFSDRKSRLAPLEDVLTIATGCHRAGGRVVLAADREQIALDVVREVRAAGVLAEDFVPTKPPYRWDEETDALIQAASVGSDHVLDDLLERGADHHHEDSSGSTALHHAAAKGNLHAVDALLAAGADPSLENRSGCSPRMLAVAAGETEAAAHLDAVTGTSSRAEGEVQFHRSHLGALYLWVGPLVVVVFVGLVLWPWEPAEVSLLVASVVLYAWVSPPRAFWAGGFPRALAGSDLALWRATGRSRTVDLRRATFGGVGGRNLRARRHRALRVLLAHPEGHRVTRRVLRSLMAPEDELDELLRGGDRFIVVPISGEDCDEVLAAVGAVLQRQGTPLSPSLRLLVGGARESTGPRPRGLLPATRNREASRRWDLRDAFRWKRQS